MSKILKKTSYTFDDVLLQPQYSEIISRSDVSTKVNITPNFELEAPLIATNMEVVISEELCVKVSELGGIALIHQFQSIELEVQMLKSVKLRNARVGATIGVTGDFIERAQELVDNGVDILLIDTPHAHSTNMLRAIEKIKNLFPNIPLIAGTIATKQGAVDLINAGADTLKVGVGAGHGCLTRVNTGVGVPQLSAIIETYNAVKTMGKTIISDGGINTPGDFAKAIAGGATAIQVGRIFASTAEAPSKLVELGDKKYKVYHGSASLEAKLERSKNDPEWKKDNSTYIEGIEGLIPYEGSINDVFSKYIMGLRSAMSYSGAKDIIDFQNKAIFLKITPSGARENGSYGVIRI